MKTCQNCNEPKTDPVCKNCGFDSSKAALTTARVPSCYDFPEDWAGENGQYQHDCTACGIRFIGNKHRLYCKICFRPQPTPAQGSVSDTPETDALEVSYLQKQIDICSIFETVRTLERERDALREENDVAKDLISLYAEGKDAESLRREALIVRKDEALRKISAYGLSSFQRIEMLHEVIKIASQTFSPTISSSLVEDKERLLEWKSLAKELAVVVATESTPDNPRTFLVIQKYNTLVLNERAARNSSKPI